MELWEGSAALTVVKRDERGEFELLASDPVIKKGESPQNAIIKTTLLNPFNMTYFLNTQQLM